MRAFYYLLLAATSALAAPVDDVLLSARAAINGDEAPAAALKERQDYPQPTVIIPSPQATIVGLGGAIEQFPGKPHLFFCSSGEAKSG
jgi:hypothetical protein